MHTLDRWKHFTALALIGDGVMALLRPRQDASAWARGPRAWRRLMKHLGKHPELTRTIGAAQVAVGIGWALAQERKR